MPKLDIFSTYYMAGMVQEIVPQARFFRDRYFPTGEEDIFASDKVRAQRTRSSSSGNGSSYFIGRDAKVSINRSPGWYWSCPFPMFTVTQMRFVMSSGKDRTTGDIPSSPFRLSAPTAAA